MIKKVVLIVGDQKVTMDFKSVFRSKFEIISADNKDLAISKLKLNPVNAILFQKEFISNEFIRIVKLIDKRSIKIAFGSAPSQDELIRMLRCGLNDFFTLPFDFLGVISKITSICDDELIKTRNYSRNVIGTSPLIEKVKTNIVNAGSMRILFTGETGVGKSLFAKWSNVLISAKQKRSRPFEQINCANLKRDRFVDELFGHIKGSYTGAISDKKGMVELAEGGDLFLDEIGDLDLDCQAELLTYLDTYEYFKLGSSVRKKSKVRLITATNKDLKKMVSQGVFRRDLYSRICQIEINIPSLRERRSDIPFLIRNFIKKYSGFEKPYSPQIEKLYKNYPWAEGNIREFERACEYMCNRAISSEKIEFSHVDDCYKEPNKLDVFEVDTALVYQLGYKKFMKDFEREILMRSIIKSNSIRKNATKLHIDRSRLSRKISEYNIPIRHDGRFLN